MSKNISPYWNSKLENNDTEKILKIILLHDLAESITGDMTPEQISKEEKTVLENNVIKKILNDYSSSIFLNNSNNFGSFILFLAELKKEFNFSLECPSVE